MQVWPPGQLTAVPLHVPPAQTSPVVHRLPSVHEAVLFACAQPLAGTHESFVHTLESLQFVAAPETHTPPAQASPVVQALLSLQGFVLFEKTHPLAGLHESVVHPFPSLQTNVVPGWHTVATHVSRPLHRLPSSHCAFVVQPPIVADTVGIRMKSELVSDWLCAWIAMTFVPATRTEGLIVNDCAGLHDPDVSQFEHS